MSKVESDEIKRMREQRDNRVLKIRYDGTISKFDDYFSWYFYQCMLNGWGEYFCSDEYDGEFAELIPLGRDFDFIEDSRYMDIDVSEPTQEIVDEIERVRVAIVYGDSQGFVSCDTFEDAREAYAHWRTVEQSFYPEEFEDEE